MNVDNIINQITEDAKLEADNILKLANEQAQTIKSKYLAEAQIFKDSHIANIQDAAQNIVARYSASAVSENKKLDLLAKQQLIDKSFEQAKLKLLALPEEQYIQMLVNFVVSSSKDGAEQLVFSDADKNKVGEKIVEKANKQYQQVKNSAANFTLADSSRDILGGVILKNKDIETNCSIESIIRIFRDEMAVEVAGILGVV